MKPCTLREEWLVAAVALLRPLFDRAGATIPAKLRVCSGWPASGGTSAKKRSIGQCWPVGASADGTVELFISPYLEHPLHSQNCEMPGTTMDDMDRMGVLPTLVHELVHASVGTDQKHNKVFSALARKVGLEGKLTSTHAGDSLMTGLGGVSGVLGPYPHARLDLTKSPVKKQSTRMIKCECATCGYVARTARKWIEEVGAPHCPKHGTMIFELPEEEDRSDE